MTAEIAVIGECMVQLSELNPNALSNKLHASISYGGDTLNTALYLARCGVTVDYISALGDDSLSDWMISDWKRNGIGCGGVERCEDRVPGLYLIELDERGERSFKYWRKESPAATLLDDVDRRLRVFNRLEEYKSIYLSGITLAILSETARFQLLDFLKRYADAGGQIFYDGNYRRNLWNDPEVARKSARIMYSAAQVLLPTYDDETQLFGVRPAKAIIEDLHRQGIAEIAMKMGASGCFVSMNQDELLSVPAVPTRVVDTTSAGDAFNAAYISARLRGVDGGRAAVFGNRLASVVIQHHGAIIPAEAMPPGAYEPVTELGSGRASL